MGYAACMEKLEMHITFLFENRRDDPRDTAIDGK